MNFTVPQKSTGVDVTADVNVGKTLEEAVEICGKGEEGKKVVLGKFHAATATAIRARMDNLLNNKDPEKRLTPAQTIEKMENSYRITMGKQRKSDFEKAEAILQDMSAEGRAQVLELLKSDSAAEAA